MANRGPAQAHAALLAKLGGLVGGRAYRGYFTPVDQPAMATPYMCVPWEGQDIALEHEDGTPLLRLVVPFTVYGFVGETSADPTSPQAGRRAAEIAETVLKALALDPTLGGSVDDLTLSPVPRVYDSGPVDAFGEFQMGVSLLLFAGADNLGT